MNWERHHVEVVATVAAGQATRAADLLGGHLAGVGCDPLAVRITARLQPPAGPGDDFEDLAGQLPGCRESAMRLACSADGRWASSDRQTGFIMNGCRLEPSPWITPIARAPTCARSWWPWAFI